MAKNMTEGKPLKLILAFMFPVLCGNLFQNFYNIVDSMIVGRFLGVDALAAVGSTTSLNFLVVGWITGMTSGFGILISQAYGAKDEKRLRHYVAMSTYLCVILAIIMTTGLLLANGWILTTMNTPEKIYADTWKYIAIIYAGLPATILYNMLAAIARSLGDSKTPLVFLVLSSILNIGLDFLLVAVIPLGVSGAAYATVAAQAVSGVLCLVYVWKKYEIVHFGKEERAISLRSILKLLAMGVPMALQFSITAIGTMIVQSSLNLLGSMYIASYSIGVTAVYSIVIMVVAFFWLPSFVKIFVADPTGELRAIAEQMFHISLWFYFPLGLIFLYRNTLQGIGNGLVPMLGGVFELLARGLAVFLLFEPLQFTGICICDPAAWVSALIPLIPYYYWYVRKMTSGAKK